MADHAKRTGPAVEAHYQFLLWLVPTVDRFPKAHKFVFGDRVLNVGLDVLELLVAATFTKERKTHLGQANLGIDKLRFLLRMASDFRFLDRGRYEQFKQARLLHCMSSQLGTSRHFAAVPKFRRYWR
ncbi:MAG TPA: four helix bundle protein [Gemmataceae bacterium]|nr:four helix bundle protein [Gemmataceae bacterium]